MNQNTLAPRKTFLFQTEAPFTTGTVFAGPGSYSTSFSLSGGHSLNTSNLTGTISMVRPFLNNKFARNEAGLFTGRVFALSGLERLTVTFAGEVPEPGSIAMLAFGVLGLGGLVGMRRRL